MSDGRKISSVSPSGITANRFEIEMPLALYWQMFYTDPIIDADVYHEHKVFYYNGVLKISQWNVPESVSILLKFPESPDKYILVGSIQCPIHYPEGRHQPTGHKDKSYETVFYEDEDIPDDVPSDPDDDLIQALIKQSEFDIDRHTTPY